MPATRVNSQRSKNANLNTNNNKNNNNTINSSNKCEKVNNNNNHHHQNAKNDLNDFCKNWPLSSLASNSSTFSNQSPSNVFHQLAGKKIIQEKLNQIFIPPNNSTSILASFVTSSSNDHNFIDASSNVCSDKLKSNSNLLNRSLTMNFHDRKKFLNASFSRAGISRQSLTTDARWASKNVRFNNSSDEHELNNMRVRFDMKSNQNINPYDKLFINRASNNFKFNSQQNYNLVNNLNDLPSNIDIISPPKSSHSSDYHHFNSINNVKLEDTINNFHLENDNNISNENFNTENEKNDCICCVAAKISGQVYIF